MIMFNEKKIKINIFEKVCSDRGFEVRKQSDHIGVKQIRCSTEYKVP